MLTIDDKGSIQLSISHLLEQAPTDFKSVVERYQSLTITLFYHVISSPDCHYERKFGRGRVPEGVLNMAAEDRMKMILCKNEIAGNPKGYFVNKHHVSLTSSQINEIKSVSFTLCDSEELPKHFTARLSEYGICFFHDFLEASGMRPVVYLNDQKTMLQQRQLVFNAPHLLERYSSSYDMRWENEWRIKGRVQFVPDDVAFLIVPDTVYESFIKWLESEDKDYLVMPASVFTDPLSYLRLLPKLQHLAWRQIRIFGGLLLEFDEFEPYTTNDRMQMELKAGVELACLVKAEIQQIYEERFVKRYQAFVKQLNDDVKSSDLMCQLGKVDQNANEPWLCSIDLAKAAYEELFKIQSDRITKDWN